MSRVAGGESSSFIQDIYGDGASSEGPAEEAAAVADDIKTTTGPVTATGGVSRIPQLFRKGWMWIAVGVAAGVGLAALVIWLRFRAIGKKGVADPSMDAETLNKERQQTVVGALAGGAVLAGVIILVTKLTLRWSFK